MLQRMDARLLIGALHVVRPSGWFLRNGGSYFIELFGMCEMDRGHLGTVNYYSGHREFLAHVKEFVIVNNFVC